jgi:hypothetical protein
MVLILGADINNRTVWHCMPDFPDLPIGNGNTAIGPVPKTMNDAEHTQPAFDTMNHNVATRRNTML